MVTPYVMLFSLGLIKVMTTTYWFTYILLKPQSKSTRFHLYFHKWRHILQKHHNAVTM
ncbi:hypothetical protein [Vibrio gallaecicus]|uniref:hypothetical protein n=1 Tax=Vibrio gallaecicus TaxID=552386 RepID=UPI0025B40073|nr:hypothetical protein [Vibrio gallaecicus]MDN3614264.1 hypothetical protein [Vibrio gallaecicus]